MLRHVNGMSSDWIDAVDCRRVLRLRPVRRSSDPPSFFASQSSFSLNACSMNWFRISALLLSFLFASPMANIPSAMAQTTLTLNANQRYSIGGISTLDRGKYFTYTETIVPPNGTNIGDLRTQTWSQSGLNLTPGRISTEFDQFISSNGNIPEDALRPGFMNSASLRSRLQDEYRNFLENGTRWEAPRNSNTNPLIVNSGRSSTFWPEYFRQGEQDSLFPNREAYAEFLTTYLDEVVYGTNSFLPIDAERFHVEILNEPDLHIDGIFSGNTSENNATLKASSEELARYHRDIAQAVKAVHANASVGGPGLAVTNFSGNDFRRWENTVKPFIEIAGADSDFYSIHPYERYDVQNDGSVERAVDQSPGRINAQIDMIVNQQELTHQNRVPVSLTEYGSFNRANDSGSYGNYARDLQQWDLSRDVREQMLVYLNRPDVILSATPFIAPAHFNNNITPTPENADNVLFQKFFDENNDVTWEETILGNTFRAYSQIKGEYINIAGSNGDLQAAAFRDGDTVYVMLNNLLDTNQTVDLQVLMEGVGTVASANLARLFREAGINSFIPNEDALGFLDALQLKGQEGAVLTLQLDGSNGITSEIIEQTWYGNVVAETLSDSTNELTGVEIEARLQEAVSAKLRVGYSLAGGPRSFTIDINGNSILVDSAMLGIDDGDDGLFSRELDVPIEFLVDGTNSLSFDFADGVGRGYLSSAALRVFSVSAVPEPGCLPVIALALATGLVRRQRHDHA